MAAVATVECVAMSVSAKGHQTAPDEASDSPPQAISGIQLRSRHPPAPLVTTQRLSSDRSLSGSTDSGYISQSPTPEKARLEGGQGPITEELNLSASIFFTSRVRKLRCFDKEIPETTWHRFYDLKELFSKPLYDYVSKGRAKFTAISFKLKTLGEDEANAKTCVIVMCDKSISKRVKQYFNQAIVKAQFQPCDIYADEPPLEVIVYDRPPRPIASSGFADVYGHTWDTILTLVTLCGTMLRVCQGEETRVATLGGIIKATRAGGATEPYGMTAGHIVQQEQLENDEIDGDEPNKTRYDECEESGDEDYFPENECDIELDFTLDEGFGLDDVESTTVFPMATQHAGQNTIDWSRMGHISAVCRGERNNEQNLDWALVRIDDPSYYRPNLFVTGEEDKLHTIRGELREMTYTSVENRFEEDVVLLSGTGGLKRGILSRSRSFLLQAPGQRVIETYNLTLIDEAGKS